MIFPDRLLTKHIPALGLIALFILGAVASLGAAGLAGLLGQRLSDLGVDASVAGTTIRGAVAMELAAAFPFVGWFIVIPLTFFATLGAAAFVLIGWMPRAKKQSIAKKDSSDDSTPSLDLRQTLHGQ